MDETSRHTPQSVIGAYKRSKLVAEREVERLIADEGLPAVIVAPSTPIGPRDIKPTPTGRIIVEAATGRMPAFVDTGLNLVHVDDVAEGHLLALDKGRIGENYILGGDRCGAGSHAGRHRLPVGPHARPTIKLPRGAAVSAGLWRRSRWPASPARSRSSPPMRCACRAIACFSSSEKAKRELGYTRAALSRRA